MNQHSAQSTPSFRILFLVLALFLVSIVWFTPARAATVTVTDCSAPSGAAGRLVEVITAAAAGDTVNFSCSGTITLTATLLIDKDLTIDGSGQTVTISGGNAVRVLMIDPGLTVALNQLTVSGGTVTGPAGGIYNQGTLRVTDSMISGNSATTGASGIFNIGTLTVTNSTISGNSTTSGSGGGIYNNSSATLAVANSTISGNSAPTAGGGIYNNTSGTVAITNSTLSGNSASNGGGIFNSSGTGVLTIANSTFSNNSGALGGAIQNRATASITNSTFSGNTATNRGGAIMGWTGGVSTIINSTLSGNGATNGGAGFFGIGTLNFSNTLIANSTSGVECSSTTIGTNLNNLVEDGSCSATLSGDPNLGALANNGGPTQTFAPLAGSTAIDAGDDTTCANAPVSGLDQRGASRWQGAHCDIGAYEKSPTVVSDCSGPSGFPDRLVDVVIAAPSGDTVTFSCSGTIVLNTTIILDKNLTINGSGQTVTISGGNLVRVFYVNSGMTTVLKNLTIADGWVSGDSGGGIANQGNLTIANSTISGNTANTGDGGGIVNHGPGTLTVANSTFSGNTADNGGGLMNIGTATVTNSTFSGNTANGGGINNSGTLHDANTILANSTGVDCVNSGTLGTNLNNLVEDGSCSAGLSGDPNLGTLANNGGSAQTFALLTGSIAIDAGDDTTCAAAPVSSLDQRGAPRPQGAHCDIGAFEKVSTIVTNINNSGSGSLRNALDYSAAGETITFAPGLSNGVILLASTLTLSRNVTVDGSALAAQISISGNNAVRVLVINSDVTATLDSLKIINGSISGDVGGGIYLLGGTLTLQNSTVSGNSADIGGGIYNWGGNVTVVNSTLSGNSAAFYGGGGIINTTNGFNPGTLTVQNSTLSGNTAANGTGGAIFNNDSGTLSVVNSTLSGNTAFNGGGIANQDSQTAMIRNSTLSGNTATNGGGIYNYNAYAPLSWTTFGFVNTIIANSTGGDCLNSSTIGANTNNLVEDNSCAPTLSGDPNLGALADNGGPTQTFALLVGSPAIDAGDNATCAAAPVSGFDQRGATRPTDGDANSSSVCDIGAFELGGLYCGIQGAAEPADYTFLGNVTLQVTMDGTDLNCLRVTDIPYNHPNATTPLQTGKYWQIVALQADQSTDATTDFSVNLTLPFATADTNDKLCRYTGSGWDCAANGFVPNTSITRNNIAQFSAWTVGNNSGPTVIDLSRLAAASGTTSFPGLWLALGSGLLMLFGLLVYHRVCKTGEK